MSSRGTFVDTVMKFKGSKEGKKSVFQLSDFRPLKKDSNPPTSRVVSPLQYLVVHVFPVRKRSV